MGSWRQASRHPVIEQLIQENQGVAYVAGDVVISGESRTTLWRQLGGQVVAAQIDRAVHHHGAVGWVRRGEQFRFSPYHRLFMRGNTDDQWRNHSSFVKR